MAITLPKQVRRVIVSGFGGAGKSTLSVSASAFAGDTLPLAKPVDATDVHVFNGDAEGFYGPIDSGLTPNVTDFTQCDTWADYQKLLKETLKALPAEHKYVVIDMALPSRLIVDSVKPQSIADWGKIGSIGLDFYKEFSKLSGRTVILNCQVKPAQAAVESDTAKAASEAKATGGERSTFTLDLPKGILSPWAENASLILARAVKKVKDPKDSTGKLPPMRVYTTYTSASKRLETKSRFVSKLPAELDGSMTLNRILRTCYGENL